LADFGFSSDAHSKSFQISASSKGTSGYRAPELLEDTGHYNAKVDIWGLGCILYELATNKKAFPTDWAVFHAKTSGTIPDIDLDDAFDDNDKASIRNTVHSMLQIVPNSRPSSTQLTKDFARNIESLRMAPPPDVRIDQHFQMKARMVGQEVDASTTIDHLPSSINDPIPTIVVQKASDRSHSPSAKSPDKSPVASSDTHPVPKSATRAQIEGYNEELFQAAKNGHADSVRSLLRAGAEVDSKDDEEKTALHWAAAYGHRDVVALLLGHMDLGQIAARDNGGRTALHWAAWNGHKDVVALLLGRMDLGQIAARDATGNTALHRAVKIGRKDVVALLEKWERERERERGHGNAV